MKDCNKHPCNRKVSIFCLAETLNIFDSVVMATVPLAKNRAPTLYSVVIINVLRCVIAGLATLASKPKRWPVVAVLLKSRCLAAENWGLNRPNAPNFARKLFGLLRHPVQNSLPNRIPPDCHHVKRDNHRCHFGDCPPCRQVCDKTHSACGHKCPAVCHSAVLVKVEGQKASMPWEQSAPLIERRDQPCPECKVPVTVTCLGGHETGDWPCFTAKSSSCGRPCGRRLACTNHACSLPCHKVERAPDLLHVTCFFKLCSGCLICWWYCRREPTAKNATTLAVNHVLKSARTTVRNPVTLGGVPLVNNCWESNVIAASPNPT